MGDPMLGEGARIAVVSPSGVHSAEGLAAGIAEVEAWGFEPVVAGNAHRQHRYTAGTAAERLTDIVWALTDPAIDGVWFTRGGFGTAHLLPHIPWDAVDSRPVIGFSDATALFSAMMSKRCGTAVHGPVLHSLMGHADQASRLHLRQLLTETGDVVLAGEQVAGPRSEVQGRLVGGNLCVLASLAGTPFATRAADCILLLEEIGERPYQVDRLLTQLAQAGLMDGVAGVALGDFMAPRHPADEGIDMLDVIVERLSAYDVPIVAGLAVGHGARNLAVPLGRRAVLGSDGLRVG